jgi:hypothetical protein
MQVSWVPWRHVVLVADSSRHLDGRYYLHSDGRYYLLSFSICTPAPPSLAALRRSAPIRRLCSHLLSRGGGGGGRSWTALHLLYTCFTPALHLLRRQILDLKSGLMKKLEIAIEML